ncbi:MAG: PsbP-related protein, partial [Candidatus Pacebacteria bacterium]|nr:PsbP-related protein [Candidatus Paceibacterota bacterium]
MKIPTDKYFEKYLLFHFGLLILAVILLTTVCFFIYKEINLQSSIDDSLQTQIINLQNSRVSSLISNETAGWKIYRNEKYGFEISYPNDWIKETDNMTYGYVSFGKDDLSQEKVSIEGGLTASGYLISASVSDNFNSVSLKDFALQGGGFLEKDLANTEVAGQQAVRFEVAEGYSSGPDVIVIVAFKEKFYTLTYKGFAHSETHYKFIDIFNQMLS